MIESLGASFWGKVAYGTLTVLYMLLGGYLYTATQIPYGNEPFAGLSSNQPKPLDTSESPLEWIYGLPLVKPSVTGGYLDADQPMRAHPDIDRSLPQQLDWNDVAPLMAHDSHIQHVLIALKEKQEKELTERLANLNQISVNGTSMRRNAINQEQIQSLLRDSAISQARYQTILETWALTDKDEKALRSKQKHELFSVVLGLLEDNNVDESHKVDLIDFMVNRFYGDVRLVKPLINLFDHLDEEYPIHKRRNQEFLKLYLQKRRAIFRGFEASAKVSLQPLLDYRKKTISEIRYSHAHLDRFLERRFKTRIRPLYGLAEPVAIRNFLNREKYPKLQKLSGPAYEQDYIRQSLIKINSENQVPPAGKPVMGLSQSQYESTLRSLEKDSPDTIDALLIDKNPAVRANLAWYLAERKDAYTIPLIFELMQDSHPEVRRLAAIAIGNFKLLDTQNSNDHKFTEIIRMLVNYRTNADSFARVFALSALATVGNRQKALYVIDLILNDGKSANSVLGTAAPSWKDEDEKNAVRSLIETLSDTPEEIYVKTHALKVLLAMDSNESLGILMHYLRRIYEETGTRPDMLRYVVPHMTLPQEAENVEDIVIFLATRYRQNNEPLQQPLKTLHAYLSSAYQNHRSAEFFQYLYFLKCFDPQEFTHYVSITSEHVFLMRISEYLRSTYGFWLVVWPVFLVMLISLQYGLGLFNTLSQSGSGPRIQPNRHANPAADIRNRKQVPAAAVVPIKISDESP